MTPANQIPVPPPEPGNVMTIAAWKRFTVMHYTLMAAQARADELKKQ
jgi:hypothetical protein